MRYQPAIGLLTALTAFTTLTSCAAPPPQEDDPGFSCHTHGNLVCGDAAQTHAATAWQAWDRTQGWRTLRVDPARPFRVDYVGTATAYPTLTDGEAAILWTDGKYYVFRANYTDAPSGDR
jgi:hypothetical protein